MLSKFYQRLTIAFAVLLFGSLFAKADVVSPYTMDFNTVIVTNSNATGAENRDFKVGTGWDHIYSYQEVGYNSTRSTCHTPILQLKATTHPVVSMPAPTPSMTVGWAKTC